MRLYPTAPACEGRNLCFSRSYSKTSQFRGVQVQVFTFLCEREFGMKVLIQATARIHSDSVIGLIKAPC